MQSVITGKIKIEKIDFPFDSAVYASIIKIGPLLRLGGESAYPQLGIYRHLDKNNFILSTQATEIRFLTLSAGGVPRNFFNEKNVPWLKKV